MAKNKAKEEEKIKLEHSLIDLRRDVEKVNSYEISGVIGQFN
jgi:hypothetical protein